eukprot:m.246356 g.246356  ORF g.246356 m.246356 type:complete len:815 (-) comp26646_c0_seq12:165-2609(-)
MDNSNSNTTSPVGSVAGSLPCVSHDRRRSLGRHTMPSGPLTASQVRQLTHTQSKNFTTNSSSPASSSASYFAAAANSNKSPMPFAPRVRKPPSTSPDLLDNPQVVTLLSRLVAELKEAAVPTHEETEVPCRVLVLYTGGTIGMRDSPMGYKPEPHYFFDFLRSQPMFHDPSFPNHFGPGLITPHSVYGRRIYYEVEEYSPLLDSSCMSGKDWLRVAKDIELHYSAYDAFVVLHGTDTMAYTASALSFLCEHLGKTIILTGSQIPMTEHMNDAFQNFLGALTIAGHFIIPEVTLFFAGKLFRGNRTTKIDASSFGAFASPNMPPLAILGVAVNIDWSSIHIEPDPLKPFCVAPRLDPHVTVLPLFPGMTSSTVTAHLAPDVKGVVLQAFGKGTGIGRNKKVFSILQKAIQRGVLVVMVTQCVGGGVEDVDLKESGILSGMDMTVEAALTKLSYVLAKPDLSLEEKKQLMQQDLRGELTAFRLEKLLKPPPPTFAQQVAMEMNVNSHREVEMIGHSLYPVLMNSAAAKADVKMLKALYKQTNAPGQTTGLSQQDPTHNLPNQKAFHSLRDDNQRTPLHIASARKNPKTVQALLNWAAGVYAKDDAQVTPLEEAVRYGSQDVVSLLCSAGASLTLSEAEVARSMCKCAAQNDLAAIKRWIAAGADVDVTDESGRTPLHVAALNNSSEVVDLLLARRANMFLQDVVGQTAFDVLSKSPAFKRLADAEPDSPLLRPQTGATWGLGGHRGPSRPNLAERQSSQDGRNLLGLNPPRSPRPNRHVTTRPARNLVSGWQNSPSADKDVLVLDALMNMMQNFDT